MLFTARLTGAASLQDFHATSQIEQTTSGEKSTSTPGCKTETAFIEEWLVEMLMQNAHAFSDGNAVDGPPKS